MNEKILIVDDDERIREIISTYLENEGYKIEKASEGLKALEILEQKNMDLVILDIMMPKMNGIEACIRIRKEKNIPIIMLAEQLEVTDNIYGISSGANDYIYKPFNKKELIEKIKYQLRRYKKYNLEINKINNIIEIGNLIINVDSREVWVETRKIRLTPKEFDILEFLARNKGIILSVRKIYKAVWKEDFLKSENTVIVHITNIREKIEENPKNPVYIKTIWGLGYKI